jgi:hypothetical protein
MPFHQELLLDYDILPLSFGCGLFDNCEQVRGEAEHVRKETKERKVGKELWRRRKGEEEEEEGRWNVRTGAVRMIKTLFFLSRK